MTCRVWHKLWSTDLKQKIHKCFEAWWGSVTKTQFTTLFMIFNANTLDFNELHIFRRPFQDKRRSTFVKRASRLCFFLVLSPELWKSKPLWNNTILCIVAYFCQRTSVCVLKTEKPHSVSPTSPGFLRLNSDGSLVWKSILHLLRYWRPGDQEERIEPLPNSHPLISEPERDEPYLAWRSIVKASELSCIHSAPVGRPGISQSVFNTQNLQMYLGLCCTNPAVRQIHVLW